VTVAYFDTSAVMRYLLTWRTGHRAARQAWDEADDVTSVSIVYAETRAALAAARRARSLTAPGLRLAKTAWETLWDELSVVTVDEALAVGAGELAERDALRGYDAVHLAAALAGGCDLLLSADAALCAAGRRHGLAVVDLDHVP
jgi:uncharacterized protein